MAADGVRPWLVRRGQQLIETNNPPRPTSAGTEALAVTGGTAICCKTAASGSKWWHCCGAEALVVEGRTAIYRRTERRRQWVER